jgi:hypothetical protein
VLPEPSRERVAAVRRQMASAIAATSGMAAATDAVKQEFAEMMFVQAAILSSGFQEAARKGDKAMMTALGNAMHRDALATLGIDLRQMTLTDAGLREKR